MIAPAGGPRRVDPPGRVLRDAVALRVRALAALLRADAGVERDPLDADPVLAQALQRALGERAAGARHLGAAGLGGEDRLVVLERVRHAGRARSGSGRRGRAGSRAAASGGRAARPTGGRARGTARAARRSRRRGAASVSARARARRPSRRSSTTQRSGCAGSGVDRCRSTRGAVGPARGQRRRDRRRRVDDQQVARAQVVGEVEEVGVDERPPVLGDHQPHLVARSRPAVGRCSALTPALPVSARAW